MDAAVTRMISGSTAPPVSEEEKSAKEQLDMEKIRFEITTKYLLHLHSYQDHLELLKVARAEADALYNITKKQKEKFMEDFERWYNLMYQQNNYSAPIRESRDSNHLRTSTALRDSTQLRTSTSALP